MTSLTRKSTRKSLLLGPIVNAIDADDRRLLVLWIAHADDHEQALAAFAQHVRLAHAETFRAFDFLLELAVFPIGLRFEDRGAELVLLFLSGGRIRELAIEVIDEGDLGIRRL